MPIPEISEDGKQPRLTEESTKLTRNYLRLKRLTHMALPIGY